MRMARYVCHIKSSSLSSFTSTSLSFQTIFATPLSQLVPRTRLRTWQAPTLVGQKILVTIDRWETMSRYPEGHFVRALGQVGGGDTERETRIRGAIPTVRESDPGLFAKSG
jgi:exosome complex exonuclease DIS3/RRP44